MPAFTGHTTGQADFPHPALGQDFALARATPSAASEHLLELIGFPISRSFTTYCVCLELRSLPSTGVTGFRGTTNLSATFVDIVGFLTTFGFFPQDYPRPIAPRMNAGKPAKAAASID